MQKIQTLGKCAVIRIHDLMPKKLNSALHNSSAGSGFMLMSQDDDKLMVTESVGFSVSHEEIEQVKKFFYTWGGNGNVSLSNGILGLELPSFLLPFFNEINSIPGTRVSPNLMRSGGDVYLYIEFDDSVIDRVSKSIMAFLSRDFLFEKDLIYIGNDNQEMPMILRMYLDSGYDIGNLFLVTTVWQFRDGQQKTQNEGVFQNRGNYIPKAFVNGSRDKLIFQLDNEEIQGKAPYEWVDRKKHLAEIDVKSHFFSDFYNYVIKEYSGPVICSMQVTENFHRTHYIIEKDRHIQFLKGLQNHWNGQARSDHVNYVLYAGSLHMASIRN